MITGIELITETLLSNHAAIMKAAFGVIVNVAQVAANKSQLRQYRTSSGHTAAELLQHLINGAMQQLMKEQKV